MYYFKFDLYVTAQTAEFSDWDDWSACSETCGIGNQVRFRICIKPPVDSNQCSGTFYDFQECYSQVCGKYV